MDNLILNLKKILIKNKIIILIFTFVIMLIILFLILFFNIPRLTYKFDKSTDTYIVDKAYGNTKKYIIPAEHNDKKVTGIGERAFFRHSKLEEIIFEDPDNITIIKKLSFSECPKLKQIDISCVDIIERNAFSYDFSLNNISISASDIGASAFYKCTSLESISFFEGIKTIGSLAFSYTAIKEITLPSTISVIYIDAFKYMNVLNRINLPLSKDTDSFKNNNQYLMSLEYIYFYGE